MTFFTASIATITIRFYLMMGIIIGSFIGGIPILAILALPVFLAALTGVSFNVQPKKQSAMMIVNTSKDKKMNTAA